jgi:hypothetical protein
VQPKESVAVMMYNPAFEMVAFEINGDASVDE